MIGRLSTRCDRKSLGVKLFEHLRIEVSSRRRKRGQVVDVKNLSKVGDFISTAACKREAAGGSFSSVRLFCARQYSRTHLSDVIPHEGPICRSCGMSSTHASSEGSLCHVFARNTTPAPLLMAAKAQSDFSQNLVIALYDSTRASRAPAVRDRQYRL